MNICTVNAENDTAWKKTSIIEKTVSDYYWKNALYRATFKSEEDNHQCLFEVHADTDCYDWDLIRSNPLWTLVTIPGAGYSDTSPKTGKPYRTSDFEDCDGNLSAEFQKVNFVVPIFLYRHGIDVLHVGHFPANSTCSCPFDSGCCGFAFLDREAAKKDFSALNADTQGRYLRDHKGNAWAAIYYYALDALSAEIENINVYLAGQVVGFRFIDCDTDYEDSLWGVTYSDTNDLVEKCVSFLMDNSVFSDKEAARAIAEKAIRS